MKSDYIFFRKIQNQTTKRFSLSFEGKYNFHDVQDNSVIEFEVLNNWYKIHDHWLDGFICLDHGDGTFDVDYGNGEKGQRIKREFIRLTSASLSIGDMVEGRFEKENAWYPGTLKNINSNGTFDIRYADGDEEKMVEPKYVRAMAECREGDDIEARFKGRNDWFPGRILKNREDGTYDIDYKDGARETSVRRELIILKQEVNHAPIPVSLASEGKLSLGSRVEAHFNAGSDIIAGKGKYVINLHMNRQDSFPVTIDLVNATVGNTRYQATLLANVRIYNPDETKQSHDFTRDISSTATERPRSPNASPIRYTSSVTNSFPENRISSNRHDEHHHHHREKDAYQSPVSKYSLLGRDYIGYSQSFVKSQFSDSIKSPFEKVEIVHSNHQVNVANQKLMGTYTPYHE